MNTQEYIAKLESQLAILKEPAKYEAVEFNTGSGGFYNRVGLEYKFSHQEFKYSTQWCGDAYARTVVVDCRLIGSNDESDSIYETPDGKVFVAVYSSGSPENFDSWEFVNPA